MHEGTIFENYVYLVIKNRNPQFVNYVYENGIEIDFFIDKRLLVEVKYDRNLNEKQEMLFKNFNAEEKLVVGNRKDITELEKYFEKR